MREESGKKTRGKGEGGVRETQVVVSTVMQRSTIEFKVICSPLRIYRNYCRKSLQLPHESPPQVKILVSCRRCPDSFEQLYKIYNSCTPAADAKN